MAEDPTPQTPDAPANPEHTEPSPGPALPESEAQASFFSIVRELGPASVLAVMALSVPAIGGTLLLVYINTAADWLQSHESVGVLIYMAAFAILAGLALLPTYAQAILGGWAFGVWVGVPAALAGFLGGSLIGYVIARTVASDRAMQVIEKRPKWEAVRAALVDSSWLKTLGIVTLIRIPPNSPFAATNLLLASVRTPLSAYAIGTLVGMAPRTIAAVWIAAGFREQFATVEEGLDQPKPWWFFALSIALVLVVLFVIGKIANRAIERVTSGAGESAGS